MRIRASRPREPGITGSAGEGEPNERFQGSGGGAPRLSYGEQRVGFMVIGKNLREVTEGAGKEPQEVKLC